MIISVNDEQDSKADSSMNSVPSGKTTPINEEQNKNILVNTPRLHFWGKIT